MNVPAVTPFPFASLEGHSRKEVAVLTRLKLVARDLVRLDDVATALSDLMDERVSARIRQVRSGSVARVGDETIGVLLSIPGERSSSRRVLVEMEGALAVALTARALRQHVPKVIDGKAPHPPAFVGAVAAVLLTALRRTHAGAPLTVLEAGPGSALAQKLSSTEHSVMTAWLTVLVGDEAFDARVSIPNAAAITVVPRAFTPADLRAMGDARLALPLVVATTVASRVDLDALARGDAFVPANVVIALHESGALRGPVSLVAPCGEEGLAADLAEGGQLVIREGLRSHLWEHDVSLENRHAAASNTAVALEDAPVVVRVELGTVEMRARDWAALGPGDIVAIGRKLGDPAILRVGGVELARGDLVHIEGELAVRIVSRTTTDGEQK